MRVELDKSNLRWKIRRLSFLPGQCTRRQHMVPPVKWDQPSPLFCVSIVFLSQAPLRQNHSHNSCFEEKRFYWHKQGCNISATPLIILLNSKYSSAFPGKFCACTKVHYLFQLHQSSKWPLVPKWLVQIGVAICFHPLFLTPTLLNLLPGCCPSAFVPLHPHQQDHRVAARVVPLGCPLQPCSPTVNQTNSKEADPQIQPKEALSSSHSDQLSSLNPRSQTPRFMHFTFSFLFLSDQVHPDTCMQLSCKPAFLCQCWIESI